MSDLERQYSGEKSIAQTKVHDDHENEDPEYAEYLVLAEEYTGDKMKRLTVSRAFLWLRASMSAELITSACHRLPGCPPADFYLHV